MPNVDFQAAAPYELLGEPGPAVTDLWLVFHGYGQLAARFIQKFSFLSSPECLIVAPQGPDRFYFGQFQKVGASWTTREHRDLHLQNQQRYLDAVWADVTASLNLDGVRIHALAFSQGVSVMTRWLSSRKVPVVHMVLWAGGYPEDVAENAWAYLPETSSVTCVVGNKDEYLNPERMESERKTILARHPKAAFRLFDGGHEMPAEVLREVLEGND